MKRITIDRLRREGTWWDGVGRGVEKFTVLVDLSPTKCLQTQVLGKDVQRPKILGLEYTITGSVFLLTTKDFSDVDTRES